MTNKLQRERDAYTAVDDILEMFYDRDFDSQQRLSTLLITYCDVVKSLFQENILTEKRIKDDLAKFTTILLKEINAPGETNE